jgi:hypothetical protein
VSKTLVESLTGPEDFHFVTIVPKRGKGAGGWQAACVPFHLRKDTGELYICKLGVGIPIENAEGPISRTLAMRVSADCANQAAQVVFSIATPTHPLVLACENFRIFYHAVLSAAIAGAKVDRVCDEKAERALKRGNGI